MAGKDRLREYRARRNLDRSGEPDGAHRHADGTRRFVIQKHDASSLHYDFRLEVDGALVSFAVPKGPSTDPSDRRLAIRTEDHPLDYLEFEGVIPEGEYGAGTVLVWDTGTYRNLQARKGRESIGMQDALKHGLVEVWLQGEKLTGGYALKRIDSGEDERWLLIKMDDEHADARRRPTSTQPASVLTGRDLAAVREDGGGS
jgi:DNA ligase D-like protein (predicted 3'-phosphoesterase)